MVEAGAEGVRALVGLASASVQTVGPASPTQEVFLVWRQNVQNVEQTCCLQDKPKSFYLDW